MLKKIILLLETLLLLALSFSVSFAESDAMPYWERMGIRIKGGYNYYDMSDLNNYNFSVFPEPYNYYSGIERGVNICTEVFYISEMWDNRLEGVFGYERLEANSMKTDYHEGGDLGYRFPAEGLYISLPIAIGTWDLEGHYLNKKRRKRVNLGLDYWDEKEKREIKEESFWEAAAIDWKLSLRPSIGFYRLQNAGFDLDTKTKVSGSTEITWYPIGWTDININAKDTFGWKIELDSEWLIYDILILGVGTGYRWLKFRDTSMELPEVNYSEPFVPIDYSGYFVQAIIGIKF